MTINIEQEHYFHICHKTFWLLLCQYELLKLGPLVMSRWQILRPMMLCSWQSFVRHIATIFWPIKSITSPISHHHRKKPAKTHSLSSWSCFSRSCGLHGGQLIVGIHKRMHEPGAGVSYRWVCLCGSSIGSLGGLLSWCQQLQYEPTIS